MHKLFYAPTIDKVVLINEWLVFVFMEAMIFLVKSILLSTTKYNNIIINIYLFIF